LPCGYDPQLGRFAQADTIIPPGVQGLDRYAYGNNSPLKYTDPSGHVPLLVIVALVGAVIFFSQVPSDQYQPDPANHGDPTVMAVGFSLMLLPLAKEAAVAGLEAISSFGDNPAGLPDDPSLVPVDVNEPLAIPNNYPSSEPGSTGPYQSPYGYPDDPTKPPTDDFEWLTKRPDVDTPETGRGTWENPKENDYFHYHSPSEHGDHYDYTDKWIRKYRVWPDGSMTPK